MGCGKRPIFDLNELPTEEEDEDTKSSICQPQKLLPVMNPHALPASDEFQRISNNSAFRHAQSGSGFQPFVRNTCVLSKQKTYESRTSQALPSAAADQDEGTITANLASSCVQDSQEVEREEGEWSDMEGNADVIIKDATNKQEIAKGKSGGKQQAREEDEPSAKVDDDCKTDSSFADFSHNEVVECLKDSKTNDPSVYSDCNPRIDIFVVDVSGNPSLIAKPKEVKEVAGPSNIEVVEGLEDSKTNDPSVSSDCNPKNDMSVDVPRDPSLIAKPKEVKGIEAAPHALKLSNNPVKRTRIDEQKEAMLGKKRARQTVFINVEEAKQATMKTTTPRRQTSFSTFVVTRTIKETSRANHAVLERSTERNQLTTKDHKQLDSFENEHNTPLESSDQNTELNGDINGGSRIKKLNNNELSSEVQPALRQGSWKQFADSRQFKQPPASSRKPPMGGQLITDQKSGNKKNSSKKPPSSVSQYQDTSVERLLREVTSDKFWHHPEETELQSVPGHFDSVEEYVRVFEPLLFEECRAQLYSTYEELNETARDAHTMVRVKLIDRRERGWFDVIILPTYEIKWTFKEGDVAVLSSSRPGSVRSRRNNSGTNDEDAEHDANRRVVGTVRRHIPIDTRDPPGVIFHFYVGDSFDSNSKNDDDHVLRKLQPKSTWYLSVLGSLATTQREYIGLHAFRHLNLQMQSAILKPSPDHFPKYEEQTPSMPDCFTQNFVDHLHRSFNGPQLAAIQWAATHTAAGTSNGSTRRQDPWPFTLVQGPPGTGKTHTVWGMLNVIHLVQYQHYYTALLKKLAPESYKQITDSSCESASTGSIDEVLQSMDQSLLRTLPKLCPKPRMLVCAPSNAATDELLARVLDRGFIDGEMKVYRPDVARVGVDSQTRAAQAVSVERRTEQLLLKGREEVIGWLHQLKTRESNLAQDISNLQRELNATAAAGRSQGSVGIDPDVLAYRDQNRDQLLQNLAAAVESRDKVLVEMSRLLILESRFRLGSTFNLEDARASLEASFANEAEIVFTTVSSSGRRLFSRLTHGFDMVVIDEAAQASEVAVLPPLSLGAARCVLVGDPQQLPATVISKAAGTLLYSRSLFERFQQAGCPTMLLSVQYRMHPQIRDFPSRYFYQGRLTDSESVLNSADEVFYVDPLLQPYIFYDVVHGRESHRGGSVSYQNVHEAQFVLRLYEHLQKIVKANGGKKVSVGIITPYKLQLKCLQREFDEILNTEEGKDIYINTVDAFQGQERDVIIMSCVRASNHGVGFVADIRRMNVALTRAKRALWIVGNAAALMQSEDWAALISDAKSRTCFLDMNNIPKEFISRIGSLSAPGKGSSINTRNSRYGGPRQRHLDILPEPKSGSQGGDEDKSNALLPRNGSYRNMKPTDPIDDLGHLKERSRDSFQYGTNKRQNASGASRREPLNEVGGKTLTSEVKLRKLLEESRILNGPREMMGAWHEYVDALSMGSHLLTGTVALGGV